MTDASSDDAEADAVFAQLLGLNVGDAYDTECVCAEALSMRLAKLGVPGAGSSAARLTAAMSAASSPPAAARGVIDRGGFRLGFAGYCSAVMGEPDERWLAVVALPADCLQAVCAQLGLTEAFAFASACRATRASLAGPTGPLWLRAFEERAGWAGRLATQLQGCYTTGVDWQELLAAGCGGGDDPAAAAAGSVMVGWLQGMWPCWRDGFLGLAALEQPVAVDLGPSMQPTAAGIAVVRTGPDLVACVAGPERAGELRQQPGAEPLLPARWRGVLGTLGTSALADEVAVRLAAAVEEEAGVPMALGPALVLVLRPSDTAASVGPIVARLVTLGLDRIAFVDGVVAAVWPSETGVVQWIGEDSCWATVVHKGRRLTPPPAAHRPSGYDEIATNLAAAVDTAVETMLRAAADDCDSDDEPQARPAPAVAGRPRLLGEVQRVCYFRACDPTVRPVTDQELELCTVLPPTLWPRRPPLCPPPLGLLPLGPPPLVLPPPLVPPHVLRPHPARHGCRCGTPAWFPAGQPSASRSAANASRPPSR